MIRILHSTGPMCRISRQLNSVTWVLKVAGTVLSFNVYSIQSICAGNKVQYL